MFQAACWHALQSFAAQHNFTTRSFFLVFYAQRSLGHDHDVQLLCIFSGPVHECTFQTQNDCLTGPFQYRAAVTIQHNLLRHSCRATQTLKGLLASVLSL